MPSEISMNVPTAQFDATSGPTPTHSQGRTHRGRKPTRTAAHPADDPDARAARDAAQQAAPRALYLADLLQVIPEGYSLP